MCLGEGVADTVDQSQAERPRGKKNDWRYIVSVKEDSRHMVVHRQVVRKWTSSLTDVL